MLRSTLSNSASGPTLRPAFGPDGTPAFCAQFAAAFAQNGYHFFPLPPRTKKTHWPNWNRFCRTKPTPEQVARWQDRYGHYGLAIACGPTCVAIDIDEEDASRAEELYALAVSTLGPTPLIRFGRAPRRVLVYRVDSVPLLSCRLSSTIELIGMGRYFVAHGLHPGTGRAYKWSDRAPESCHLSLLPAVNDTAIAAFAGLVRGLCNEPPPPPDLVTTDAGGDVSASNTHDAPQGLPRWPVAPPRRARADSICRWMLDAQGRVCDGREAYLASLVYGAFCQGHSEAGSIAETAWAQFVDTADLTRPKHEGRQSWTRADALTKAGALLKRGKVRPSRNTAGSNVSGFWTPSLLKAHGNIVAERGALGLLSPAAVRVSRAMSDYVRGDGSCFASPRTLAISIGIAEGTVKHARRALLAAGLWTVANNNGGRRRGADYSPNRDVLPPSSEISPSPDPALQNGYQNSNPKYRVGGGSGHQDQAGDGAAFRPKTRSRVLGSLSSNSSSPKCREKRSRGAANAVAEVPPSASDPSPEDSGGCA